MIRGKERVATAVRRPDGTISVLRERAEMSAQRHPWLGWPFLRGTPALIDSMRLGYRTLMWSADQAGEAEAQPVKPTPLQYFLTVTVAFAFSIGFFVLLPTFAVNHVFPWAKHIGNAHDSILTQLIPSKAAIIPNLIEGLIRVLLLVGYILFIKFNVEIKRIFAYHGAEHKVVNAWEAGVEELSVENTRPFSRIHPRCGTSFLFLVFVVGILVHALIGWPRGWVLLASRLVLLPLVVGVSYELIRLSGRYRESRLLRILVWPGMLLQRLTTAEPGEDQIAVAIASLRAVLVDEGTLPPEAPPVPAGVEAEANLSCAPAT